MDKIIITNEKIVNFYNNNKNISIEEMNIFFIDLFTKLIDNCTNTNMFFDRISTLIDKQNTNIHSNTQLLELQWKEIKLEVERLNIAFNSKFNDCIKDNMIKQNEILCNNIKLEVINSIPSTQSKICIEFIDKMKEEFKTIGVNKMVEELLSISDRQDVIKEKFDNYLNKFVSGNFKGKVSEHKLQNVLNNTFPSYNIIDSTHNSSYKGDFVIERPSNVDIIIENKDYNINVGKAQIEKFIRDCELHNCHGIFLSQSSGIVKKDNFQIDIINTNKILIYIHNVNYDGDKIKLAYNILNIISDKIIDNPTGNYNIDKNTMDNILLEYKNLKNVKDNLLKNLKDYYKKHLTEINNIEFESLEKYLINDQPQCKTKKTKK